MFHFILWYSCSQSFKSLPMNLILFENNVPFYPMDFMLSMLQIITYESYIIWKQCSILSYGFYAFNAPIVPYLLAFAPSFLGSWARVRKIGGCSVWQYRWGVGCGNIEWKIIETNISCQLYWNALIGLPLQPPAVTQRWASTLANRSYARHRSNLRAPFPPPPALPSDVCIQSMGICGQKGQEAIHS